MRALGVELGDDRKKVRERPRQPVESRHYQHVAAPNPRHGLGQFRSRSLCARHMLAKNLGAAGRLQHVDLGVGRLVIG